MPKSPVGVGCYETKCDLPGQVFKESVNITGIIMTKLDGTAKGGIIIAIKNELDIPIRFIGVGEVLMICSPLMP